MNIYFDNKDLLIRDMKQEDAQVFFDIYFSYGWHPQVETYLRYFKEQEEGRRKVFVAEYNNEIAGICTLILRPTNGPWANTNYPEISDLSVFIKYRKLGIGNKLLDAAECEAFKISNKVCLAVGLHSGYGEAQRIYVKRGYNFDGSGVWYQNKPLEQYVPCVNDDDLLLYMSKVK